MSHSHVCCLIHVVFATSGRRAMIRRDMEDKLHNYLGGIALTHGIQPIAIGGTADHVHLLLALPRTLSIGKSIQLLKSGSSKWVHETFPESRLFSWQEGYGAFSVGVSQRQTAIRYIGTQHERHSRITFADEFKKFLSLHDLSE